MKVSGKIIHNLSYEHDIPLIAEKEEDLENAFNSYESREKIVIIIMSRKTCHEQRGR